MERGAWTFIAVLGLAWAGCSKPITQENFCEEYAKRYCARSDSCCEGGRDLERCELGAQEDCKLSMENAGEAFDLSAAGACIEALDDSEGQCDRRLVMGAEFPCRKVFPEVQSDVAEAGASCTELPCADGLVCDEDSRICEAPPPEGGSCAEPSVSCAPEMRCNPDTLTCEKKKEGGESCLIANECISFVCKPDGTCGEVTHPFCLTQY